MVRVTLGMKLAMFLARSNQLCQYMFLQVRRQAAIWRSLSCSITGLSSIDLRPHQPLRIVSDVHHKGSRVYSPIRIAARLVRARFCRRASSFRKCSCKYGLVEWRVIAMGKNYIRLNVVVVIMIFVVIPLVVMTVVRRPNSKL